MKSKLKGAQTGHDLLKRKSEALTKYDPPISYPPTLADGATMIGDFEVPHPRVGLEISLQALILAEQRSHDVSMRRSERWAG